ncbi:oligosaccharide flippase family protein [Jeotgalibaca sp. A122]|uniref:oligosaccharide flippase family protein n=1 Tax=Jeotgalibaca sp. A122 TaxID=3457322 RepID=UPI003FD48755
MPEIFRKLITKKHSISLSSKNIVKVTSGTLVGQIISFATLPMLTRIYGASIMGIWAIIASLTFIIKAFSDLGIGNAIMVSNDEEVLDLYSVVSTISLVITILVSGLIFIYYSFFPSNEGLSAFWMALIIAVNSWTAKQVDICYAWLNRDKNYQVLMKNPIISQVSIFIFSVSLGLLGFKGFGYFIGSMAGSFFSLLNMKRYLPTRIFTIQVKKYKYVLHKNKNFIKYQMPSDLLGRIKDSLPTLLINFIFGSEAVGYYSLSMRMISTPVNLLGTSVGRVFFSDIAEKKRNGLDYWDDIHKTINTAFKICIIPLIFILAFGDVFTVILLGEGWYVAGQMLRIATIIGLFTFIMMSTLGIDIVLEKQSYTIIASVAQIINGIFSFFIVGKIFDSPYISLVFNCILTMVIQTVYYTALYKVMNKPIWMYLKNVLTNLIIIFFGSLIFRYIGIWLGIVDSII